MGFGTSWQTLYMTSAEVLLNLESHYALARRIECAVDRTQGARTDGIYNLVPADSSRDNHGGLTLVQI